MNKTIVMVSTVAIVMASFGAMAQQPAQQEGGQGAQQNQQQQQERFEDMKQKIAQRIQDRISKMQERLSCVQSAQNPESLRACFPKRNGRGPGRPGAEQGDKQGDSGISPD